MTNKPFKIYKSSAGSGKTYTLSKNYIRIALKSKFHFKKILAVTFTNKAAEEMKIRILDMIESVSNGDNKDLIIEFSKYYKLSPEEIILRAKNLKTNILHNYSYFSITTIDTFFYSIIQSFTRELKFRGKYNIEMDIDYVIEEVVDSFLASIKSGSHLSKWLTQFSKEKIILGKDFMINQELKKMTKNLFSEDFKSLIDDIPENGYIDIIKNLKDEVQQIINSFENKVISLANEMYKIILENGYDIDDFNYKKSGVAGYIKKIAGGMINYPGSRVLKCNENSELWVNKNHKSVDQILLFINKNLTSKLSNLIDVFENEFIKYNSSIDIRANLYTYGILGELQKFVRNYRDDNEVILISDISELLYEVIKDEKIPFIFEKVGNNFNHFLIDEFQDTSHFQWKNFKSLISESLASGNENIIVGDIKQSIYRWRGSDSEIMDSNIMTDINSDITSITNLNTNWRSSEEIINFNNYIFCSLPTFFEGEIKSRLERIYNDDIKQKITDDMIGKGCVEIVFKGKEDTRVDSARDYTISTIKKIQDKGYNAGDIGIIVRDNKDARLIAETLIEESLKDSNYNFNHVSADALDIKNSPVVNFFISVFNYFSNFKDRIALSEILHFYYRFVLNSTDTIHYSLSNEDKLNLLPNDFSKNISEISRLPIYDLVEELVRIFSLNTIKGQVPFLQAFYDIILEYKLNYGREINSFLEWWEKNNNKKLNISANDDAIQLITIHKSKGLEFNHVIIPFFDWSLDNDASGGKEKLIWVNLNKFNSKFNIPYPIKYKTSNQKSLFTDEYANEKNKAFEDNINLMYVSMTRPKYSLFINAENITGRLKNVSDILAKSIQLSTNNNTYQKGLLSKKPSQSINDKFMLKNIPSFSWRDRIMVRMTSESGIEFDNYKRGKKIHDVLSLIYNNKEVDISIEKAQEKNIITKDEVKSIKKLVEKLISNKEIKDFFNPHYKSYNEVEILDRNGDVFRLDRIVQTHDNSLHVLDYKTGEIDKKYNDQVKNYKKILSEIYRENIYGYIIYVDLNKIVSI